jgi:hypothetical protein
MFPTRIFLLFTGLLTISAVAAGQIGPLDIPVGLRFVLSVIPSFVLYRVVFTLYGILIAQRPVHSSLVGFLIIVTGIAGLFLCQIWRNVKLDDFKRRRESDIVPLFGDSEIRSADAPSFGEDKLN